MPATYENIATQTLGSTATSIIFSSIAASWTDLKLIIVGKPTTSVDPLIRFNSDTGSNYSYTRFSGNGTSVGNAQGVSTTSIPLCQAVGWPTTNPSFFAIDIFSYAGSRNKTIIETTSSDQNGSGLIESVTGLWRNTAAITSITFLVATSSIAAGTTATLYGIKAA
jgi:hypothetical protein